ncbi:MAG: polyphenol oxidase family protein [Spirochaetia bacterium]
MKQISNQVISVNDTKKYLELNFHSRPWDLSPRALLSLKEAGDMKFIDQWENREKFFSSQGIDPMQVKALNQVHSKTVFVVNSGTQTEQYYGDGLVSNDNTVVLSVTVADCLPGFLWDMHTGALGIVHSGWKGTGIIADAVRQMKREYGSQARHIKAIIGPCIRETCYEVDKQRAESFANEFGKDSVCKTEGKYYLNLLHANRSLLEKQKVEDIVIIENCTHCSPQMGSFRRESNGYSRMTALLGYF